MDNYSIAPQSFDKDFSQKKIFVNIYLIFPRFFLISICYFLLQTTFFQATAYSIDDVSESFFTLLFFIIL